jgi:hypothetical protein
MRLKDIFDLRNYPSFSTPVLIWIARKYAWGSPISNAARQEIAKRGLPDPLAGTRSSERVRWLLNRLVELETAKPGDIYEPIPERRALYWAELDRLMPRLDGLLNKAAI